MTPLTPANFRKRLEILLDLWKERGFDVGGLTVKGDEITILTPTSVQKPMDEFERWEAQNATKIPNNP